jgi:hypothetical protein
MIPSLLPATIMDNGRNPAHFGAVTARNVYQRPTFDPESSLLWESTTLTVAQSACRPPLYRSGYAFRHIWARPSAGFGGAWMPSRAVLRRSVSTHNALRVRSD